MLRLFGSFEDIQSGSGSERRGRSTPLQFVARDTKGAFLINPVPIRERTALNVDGHGLCRLVDRVGAKVGKASLDDGLVFFWSSFSAIVGWELRKIRPITADPPPEALSLVQLKKAGCHTFFTIVVNHVRPHRQRYRKVAEKQS